MACPAPSPLHPSEDLPVRHPVVLLAIGAAVALAGACKSSTTETVVVPKSNIINFKATMSGASEVPANATTGTGTFTATLDTVTNVFTYDITFSGLTSNVNNGHIHGPAVTTVSSGTTINFNTLTGATFGGFGATTGTAHGQVTLNGLVQITAAISGDSLRKILLAGLTYANIHTVNNPGGEIRGQILKQ